MIDFEKLEKFSLDDYIKDTFIGFYQHLFSENKSEFHYDPDKERSRINISDQFSTEDLTPDFKPTIYIRRQPFSYVNTSIDQFLGAQGINGAHSYTDLVAGSIEVVCVSSVELEACRMASLIFLLTNQFRDELVKKANLYKVEVKALGMSQPLEAASTMRVVEVPVLVQLMFPYDWELVERQVGPILQGIEIGRSTDPVTGEPITAEKPVDECNPADDRVDLGSENDGRVKICVPFTSIDNSER